MSARATLARTIGVAMLAAACGSSATTGTPETIATDPPTTSAGATATTSTTAPTASPTTVTTTSVATATDAEPPAPGLADLPPECIAPLVDFLRTIEADVASVDFATATLSQYQTMLVALVSPSETLLVQISTLADEPACNPVTDQDPVAQETARALFMDLARAEAPGTVTWLELQHEMSDLPSGDCQTNIATLQAYVDAGGTVSDLSTVERIHAFHLAGLILQWCNLRTGHGFVQSSEVMALLEVDQ